MTRLCKKQTTFPSSSSLNLNILLFLSLAFLLLSLTLSSSFLANLCLSVGSTIMGHPFLVLVLQLLLLLLSPAAADDAGVILKLANAVTPLPTGWSTTSASGFCSWDGIKCDSSKQHVISISLFRQSLSGVLPPDISTLSELQTFSVQNNMLSGDIPSFANLTNLQTIFLDNNNFSSVPVGCFQGLTSLQTLSMGNNENLAPWQLPLDLAASTTLTNLTVNQANVFGSIPDIFGSLPSLQNLRLSYNNLTGALPLSMAGSGIQNLWLNNQQTGLSGRIDVLASMNQLVQVWLQKNQFTGPIPDLVNCKNILDLQLRDNLLTGIVPASLIALPALRNVSLSNNKLQGQKPGFPRNVTVVNDGTNNYCADTGVACDPQVDILLAVAGGFGYPVSLSDKWQGNSACDGWPSVTCDSKKMNVTTVNLSKQGLQGNISPAFGNLTSLQNLYLNDNNLTGSIPNSLTTLTQLRSLDVSNNNLSGIIPVFPSTVKFITTPGNALLGTKISPSSSPGSSGSDAGAPSGSLSGGIGTSGGVIAGIVIAIIVFLAVLAFIFYKYMKRKNKSGRVDKGNAMVKNRVEVAINVHNEAPSELCSPGASGDSDHKILEGGNAAISIEVLRQVTNNFCEDNVIGRGGFGVVYKGELHDGTKIAVKRMESSLMGTKGLNEFQAEIAVLTKVRHRHLVALLGYCVNGHERLLVYEYMPQGTLGQHLFEFRDHGFLPLTWKQRVTIALDVARGVEYLHSLAQQSFIHRDLKPSNILLGDDMRAKVADFGLVRNAPDGKYSVETRLAGTFGYLAPEYAATGRVTTKVDVYAFGVVLMEMLTGRKALDDSVPDEKAHLVTWFRRILINKENIPKALDNTLDPDEETLESIYRVAELAGHCTAREPYQRPDMGHAVNILGPLVEQWRPANREEEDNYGIDLHMSLPQALQRWQADEGSSMMFNGTSYSQSHTSLPPKPFDTFTSNDAR